MMVRIEYEDGRTTLFDTLSFTEGSPFTGANMLTEFELEMRDEPEKGLWLTANWHQVRDDWRVDAPRTAYRPRAGPAAGASCWHRRPSSGAPGASCSTARRRSPVCGDIYVMPLRFPLATASTWALPQNR